MSDNLFQDYVNVELPKRISTSANPMDVVEGMIPVTSGLGLAVNFMAPGEVPGLDIGGKSAYEIAVEAGFEGTEEEWLLTLIGPIGKSAFDHALEEGFEGDVNEWLLSLVGTQGETGPAGLIIRGEWTLEELPMEDNTPGDTYGWNKGLYTWMLGDGEEDLPENYKWVQILDNDKSFDTYSLKTTTVASNVTINLVNQQCYTVTVDAARAITLEDGPAGRMVTAVIVLTGGTVVPTFPGSKIKWNNSEVLTLSATKTVLTALWDGSEWILSKGPSY